MNKIGFFCSLAFVILSCSGPVKSPITFNIWYGDEQKFGKPGMPQRWINIIGNVSSEYGLKTLSYQLNGAEKKVLTIGSDLHRLANAGDFNIDLEERKCLEGQNLLQIHASDSAGNELTKTVKFHVSRNKTWPLPYSIKWTEVSNIQDVVQVTDGHWVITKNGLHNLDIYYDRVVAFGDQSWKNYEVSTTVTFHDFTPPQAGPPTYNVSHAAIASRWPGHSEDDLQPYRQWYPLGATSEFRLTTGLDSCRWRIFDGPKPHAVNFHVEQPVEEYRSIELNKVYGMKHRVESIGDGKTRYSVKLWPLDQEEPESWDFTGIEEDENLVSGSALLIAHNTSVTFGDVDVQPINKE